VGAVCAGNAWPSVGGRRPYCYYYILQCTSRFVRRFRFSPFVFLQGTRVPTLTCRHVYTSVSTPQRNAGLVWECSRSVYITCVRACACAGVYVRGRKTKGNRRRRRGSLEEFCVGGTWATLRAKGVFWWRHAASDQWFLRRPSVRPRKYASTPWRHRQRHFRRNWPHHQPRRVEQLLSMPPTKKHPKITKKTRVSGGIGLTFFL